MTHSLTIGSLVRCVDDSPRGYVQGARGLKLGAEYRITRNDRDRVWIDGDREMWRSDRFVPVTQEAPEGRGA